MNLVFCLIKAGYQINQMVVAAAIWLSFSDLFFFYFGWSHAHFSTAFVPKAPGTTGKMRILLFMSWFYSDFVWDSGAGEDQKQGRWCLAAGRDKDTTRAFAWKVQRRLILAGSGSAVGLHHDFHGDLLPTASLICTPASSFLSSHFKVPGMKFCSWRFRISWSMVIKRTPVYIIDMSQFQQCGKQMLKKKKKQGKLKWLESISSV